MVAVLSAPPSERHGAEPGPPRCTQALCRALTVLRGTVPRWANSVAAGPTRHRLRCSTWDRCPGPRARTATSGNPPCRAACPERGFETATHNHPLTDCPEPDRSRDGKRWRPSGCGSRLPHPMCQESRVDLREPAGDGKALRACRPGWWHAPCATQRRQAIRSNPVRQLAAERCRLNAARRRTGSRAQPKTQERIPIAR